MMLIPVLPWPVGPTGCSPAGDADRTAQLAVVARPFRTSSIRLGSRLTYLPRMWIRRVATWRSSSRNRRRSSSAIWASCLPDSSGSASLAIRRYIGSGPSDSEVRAARISRPRAARQESSRYSRTSFFALLVAAVTAQAGVVLDAQEDWSALRDSAEVWRLPGSGRAARNVAMIRWPRGPSGAVSGQAAMPLCDLRRQVQGLGLAVFATRGELV